MRVGYYLAATETRCGDEELSQIAQGLWLHYGTSTSGYKNTGVSVWIANDEMTVNLIVPDLFSETPKVQQVRKSKKLTSQEKITKEYKFHCKLCGAAHIANVKDKYGVIQFPPTLTTSKNAKQQWYAHCKECLPQ